jgi:alkylated DNA repair dioxygenase AlkB
MATSTTAVEQVASESKSPVRAADKSKLPTLSLDPNNLPEGHSTVPLTKDGSAWITIEKLPAELQKYATDNFQEMWDIHPAERGKIVLAIGEIETKRWHKSYGNTPHRNPELKASYMFAGKGVSDADIKQEWPKVFAPMIDHIEADDGGKGVAAKQPLYNQVVLNWYKDGEDHLPLHSDCELGMVKDATVATISINEPSSATVTTSTDVTLVTPELLLRQLDFFPKGEILNSDQTLYSKVSVLQRHGVVVTMHGKANSKFHHGVPKAMVDPRIIKTAKCTAADVPKRISISLRQFVPDVVI